MQVVQLGRRGLVVDSPTLARRLSAGLDALYPDHAWRVARDAAGGLRWLDGGPVPATTEPGVGVFRRAAVRVMSWLPIDWLL